MQHSNILRSTWIAVTFASAVFALNGPQVAYGKTCLSNCKSEAVAFIRQLGARVDKVLDEDKNQHSNLEELISESVEFDRISRQALGRYWRKASPEQRTEYQKLFERTMLYTVARRLRDYAGARIEIVDPYAVSTTDTVVTTKIRSATGEPSRIGWRVSATRSGPTIVDVLMGGASMLVAKRHEFGAVVGKHGMTGLLNRLHHLAVRQLRESQAATAALDFRALEASLRRTRAIGFMSKVSMSFEADALKESAARYRRGNPTAEISEIRKKFDSLFNRTIAKLAMGGDLAFSRALTNSRARLWHLLIHDKSSSGPNGRGSQLALSDQSVE